MRMENIIVTSLPHYLNCAAVVILKAELGDKMFLGHKTIVDLAVRFYNVWILNCEENGNAKTMISFDVQGIPLMRLNCSTISIASVIIALG